MKFKGNGKMKLVFIKWLDSKSGSEGWEYFDNIKNIKPVVCSSVGFLIDEKVD